MDGAAPLLEAMDRAGYRITEPRRQIAALIADRDGHFTARDLVRAARAGRLGIGRATVFRTLELLDALGGVERLDLPSGEHAYVSCEPIHHHHAVCTRCQRTVEIVDAGLDAAIRDAGQHAGFAIESHRMELYGLCPECRGAHR